MLGQVSASPINWEEVAEGPTFLITTSIQRRWVSVNKRLKKPMKIKVNELKSSLGEWEDGDSPETSRRGADAIKHQKCTGASGAARQGERAVWFSLSNWSKQNISQGIKIFLMHKILKAIWLFIVKGHGRWFWGEFRKGCSAEPCLRQCCGSHTGSVPKSRGGISPGGQTAEEALPARASISRVPVTTQDFQWLPSGFQG